MSIKKTPQFYSAFPDRNPLSQTFKAQIKGNASFRQPTSAEENCFPFHFLGFYCRRRDFESHELSFFVSSITARQSVFQQTMAEPFWLTGTVPELHWKKSLRSGLQKCWKQHCPLLSYGSSNRWTNWQEAFLICNVT